MDDLERYTGCMLGGATGDALGYLIEYDDLKTIRKKYGPYGLRTVLKLSSNGNKGVISDDTQMALFTADGLFWASHDDLAPEEGIYRSYMRWYYTQTERVIHPDQEKWMKRQAHEEQLDYDLMGRQELFARRAPSKTCLTALASGKFMAKDNDENKSRGSDAVVRAAPIGMFYRGDAEKAFDVGCKAGRLTHGNLQACQAAGTLAAIISQLADGKEIGTALSVGLCTLQKAEDSVALLKKVVKAIDEAVTDRNPVHVMKSIGTGWNADEALALAVYCVLKTHALKDAVIMACNQDGDSDTCGAICGNITGAVYGIKAVPKNWLSNLECKDLLEAMAARLYEKTTA